MFFTLYILSISGPAASSFTHCTSKKLPRKGPDVRTELLHEVQANGAATRAYMTSAGSRSMTVIHPEGGCRTAPIQREVTWENVTFSDFSEVWYPMFTGIDNRNIGAANYWELLGSKGQKPNSARPQIRPKPTCIWGIWIMQGAQGCTPIHGNHTNCTR